jgi:hypothetical protein
MSVVKVLILIAGLLSTVAGSGIAVVVGYLLGLIALRRIAALRKYAVPAALLIAGFWTTVFAEAITRRFSEAADPRSSTALRATEPYVQLWPQWISDPIGILVGQGAGSSAEIVRNLPIEGLLVPSVAKVIFDYGLVGGAALIILMIFTYLRSPEPLFALTLAASMFLLQAASQPLVICSIMLLALWSPAIRPGLKTRPAPVSPGRTPRDSGVEAPVAVGAP